MRANGAPMQKWMPCPKATWVGVVTPTQRSGRSSSGSSHRRGIAVGRREQHLHLGARRDRGAVELHVARGRSEQALHGPVEAERLLDEGHDQRAVGPHARLQLGSLDQPVHDQPEQRRGGLVPGDEHLHGEADHLVAAEDPVVVRRPAHAGDDIVGKRRTPVEGGEPLVHQRAEVGVHLAPGGQLLLEVLTAETRHDAVGPLPEAVAVGDGDAEELGDGRGREGSGVAGDEVALTGTDERGEDLRRDGGDPRLERSHRCRREGLGQHPALTGVVGPVGRPEDASRGVLHAGPLLAREGRRVPQDRPDVGVAGHDEERGVVLVHAVHGTLRQQVGLHRARLPTVREVEVGEVDVAPSLARLTHGLLSSSTPSRASSPSSATSSFLPLGNTRKPATSTTSTSPPPTAIAALMPSTKRVVGGLHQLVLLGDRVRQRLARPHQRHDGARVGVLDDDVDRASASAGSDR